MCACLLDGLFHCFRIMPHTSWLIEKLALRPAAAAGMVGGAAQVVQEVGVRGEGRLKGFFFGCKRLGGGTRRQRQSGHRGEGLLATMKHSFQDTNGHFSLATSITIQSGAPLVQPKLQTCRGFHSLLRSPNYSTQTAQGTASLQLPEYLVQPVNSKAGFDTAGFLL